MKVKTRIAIITLALCSLFLTTASADAKYLFDSTRADVEYSYEGISDDKAGDIIFNIFGDESHIVQKDGEVEVKPFVNLLCIFGHSKQTGTVTQISHSYYTTSPKCREISSFVEYCTRDGCDYFEVMSQFEARIGCH